MARAGTEAALDYVGLFDPSGTFASSTESVSGSVINRGGSLVGSQGRAVAFACEKVTAQIDELPPKTGRRWLAPDQAVIVETPGAGGYGQPADRAAEHLKTDRASDKFSNEYMRRHYKE